MNPNTPHIALQIEQKPIGLEDIGTSAEYTDFMLDMLGYNLHQVLIDPNDTEEWGKFCESSGAYSAQLGRHLENYRNYHERQAGGANKVAERLPWVTLAYADSRIETLNDKLVKYGFSLESYGLDDIVYSIHGNLTENRGRIMPTTELVERAAALSVQQVEQEVSRIEHIASLIANGEVRKIRKRRYRKVGSSAISQV